MAAFRVELAAQSHDVIVGPSLLARLGELARDAGLKPGRAALVTERDHVPVRHGRTGTTLREPVPGPGVARRTFLPGTGAGGWCEDGRHCPG